MKKNTILVLIAMQILFFGFYFFDLINAYVALTPCFTVLGLFWVSFVLAIIDKFR